MGSDNRQYHDKYGTRGANKFDWDFWDPYLKHEKELDGAAYDKIAGHTAQLENFYANGGGGKIAGTKYSSPFDLFAKAAGSKARSSDSHGADVGKVKEIFDHIYNWDGDALEVYGPPKTEAKPESAPGEQTPTSGVEDQPALSEDVQPPDPVAETESKIKADTDVAKRVTQTESQMETASQQQLSAQDLAQNAQELFAGESVAADEEQKSFRAKAKERAQIYANS